MCDEHWELYEWRRLKDKEAAYGLLSKEALLMTRLKVAMYILEGESYWIRVGWRSDREATNLISEEM